MPFLGIPLSFLDLSLQITAFPETADGVGLPSYYIVQEYVDRPLLMQVRHGLWLSFRCHVTVFDCLFIASHCVSERGTAFPCAPAAVLAKTDAVACGAAAGPKVRPAVLQLHPHHPPGRKKSRDLL